MTGSFVREIGPKLQQLLPSSCVDRGRTTATTTTVAVVAVLIVDSGPSMKRATITRRLARLMLPVRSQSRLTENKSHRLVRLPHP